MKIRCHICDKVAADIRDASIAKGAVMVCPRCIESLAPLIQAHGNPSDPMPPFMRDFLRGFGR